MTSKRGSLLASMLLAIALTSWFLPNVRVDAAEDYGSLQAAIEAANSSSDSGTITLTDDITLSAALPPITGQITIEGGDHSISGDGMYRIFDVSGGTLTVKNLILKNGKALGEEYGGAIRLRNGARVSIEDSMLSENRATNGGAIATSSSNDKVTVTGSSFTGNKADKNAAAIYANGGSISISDSSFEKNCAERAVNIVNEDLNRATEERIIDSDGCLHVTHTWTDPGEITVNIEGKGGAIRLMNGAQVSVESSTFIENKSTKGGALATSGSEVRLSVSSSRFSRNSALADGGAVYVNGGTALVTQSSFTDNDAMSLGGVFMGGAGKLVLSNSTLRRNRANSSGGELAVLGAEVTVSHVTMSANHAYVSGSAISKLEGIVKLYNTIIAGIDRGQDCVGGLDQMTGVLSNDGTCSHMPSDDLLLDSPRSEGAWLPLKDFSPAIDAADPDYCLETDQIGTPRPQGGGCDIGAIESTTALPKPPPIEPPPPCPLALRIVAANTDAPAGGCPAGSGHDVIILSGDITLSAPLPQITSDITILGDGYTISGGGRFRIFNVIAGKMTINNLTMVEGNVAGSYLEGGAIWLQGSGELAINGSVFRGNDASLGGAIAIDDGAAKLTVDGVSFVENRAKFGGGAISAYHNSQVSIMNSSFARNVAGDGNANGGAIFALHGDSINVSNSTFVLNWAGRGGAIHVRWTPATLTHVTMFNNLAQHGSGIFVYDGGRDVFRVRNSLIKGSRFRVQCYGPLTQNVGNFIADGTCSPKLSGDAFIKAPATDSLPTYVELLPDSPAIDAGEPAYCLPTDQIGNPRPQEGPCDIGAIESVPIVEDLSACSVTTTHTLNFREEPDGKIIGGVQDNETLTAVARTPSWFNVEHRGTLGWISADYVVAEGDCG